MWKSPPHPTPFDMYKRRNITICIILHQTCVGTHHWISWCSIKDCGVVPAGLFNNYYYSIWSSLSSNWPDLLLAVKIRKNSWSWMYLLITIQNELTLVPSYKSQSKIARERKYSLTTAFIIIINQWCCSCGDFLLVTEEDWHVQGRHLIS